MQRRTHCAPRTHFAFAENSHESKLIQIAQWIFPFHVRIASRPSAPAPPAPLPPLLKSFKIIDFRMQSTSVHPDGCGPDCRTFFAHFCIRLQSRLLQKNRYELFECLMTEVRFGFNLNGLSGIGQKVCAQGVNIRDGRFLFFGFDATFFERSSNLLKPHRASFSPSDAALASSARFIK